jgi:two-component system, NarL family, nitrate/nitrite response regulator NarL
MQPLPTTIRAVLVDDHPLIRYGVRSLLKTFPEVQVIAEVGDGAELLELLDSVVPDMVISDISMPVIDGLAALSEITVRHPEVKVIVLSMHDSPDLVKRAIGAGAAAYLHKNASESELASAIQRVMTTGSYISAAVAKLLMEPPEPAVEDLLTARQIEILTLVAKGKTSKEIGFGLGLSSKTVDGHRARIMDRLGLRDVASLVVYAIRKRLL